MKEEKKKNPYERIVLAGTPNVGKSVIFGLLTGKYVTVSNYPGTTVEISSGNIRIGDRRLLIVDSPGVNNFLPMSEDERVTRDLLLSEKSRSVVLVADSKNLKRALMLLVQLAEMELPCVLVLNMEDEARARGIEVDAAGLRETLGIPVIPTVAPQRKGIQKLKESLLAAQIAKMAADYGDAVEQAAEAIGRLLPESGISKRALGLMILAGDESLREWLIAHLSPETIERIETLRDEAQLAAKEPIAAILSRKRIAAAEGIVRSVVRQGASEAGHLARWLGRMTMHPVWGTPLLLLVLYGFYLFVGEFGAGILVDFFEETIFGTYLGPALEKVVTLLVPWQLGRDFFIGQYGLFTMALTYAVAIILPITATFFIAFGFLEDSGYLPRIAVLSNAVFAKIGLNGKAVLPMVLGLGCGTMATMTTRILETRRERLIATFLISLAIPCSAQLGVILGMLGPYPVSVTLWWVGTILVVLLAAGTITARVLPGEKADFFLELPPIRLPRLGNILMKTLNRIEWYLKEAVPLFILGTFILFVFDKLRLLGWLERLASPVVVTLLGLPEKTTSAFLLGFLRRDYGAAGLFDLAKQGLLDERQIIVSIVTLSLFVPCLASFFMIVKERGVRTAGLMFALITVLALAVGAALNLVLRLTA
ncbi:MAG: ferrous iron transport protein B [Thermodesulfovibrionales bacterium]